MKAFLLGALLLFVIGCQEEQPISIPEEPAAVAQPIPQYDRSAYPEEIVLTEHGLFGYWEESAFSIDSMRALLPAFEVVAGTGGSEGQTWDILTVKKGQAELLQIDSDFLGNVGKVSTSSSQVGVDTRHRVGMTFSEVFLDRPDVACYPGVEELTGEVICAAPDRNQLFYVFSGSRDGPDTRIPPQNELATWRISSIFWTSK